MRDVHTPSQHSLHSCRHACMHAYARHGNPDSHPHPHTYPYICTLTCTMLLLSVRAAMQCSHCALSSVLCRTAPAQHLSNRSIQGIKQPHDCHANPVPMQVRLLRPIWHSNLFIPQEPFGGKACNSLHTATGWLLQSAFSPLLRYIFLSGTRACGLGGSHWKIYLTLSSHAEYSTNFM